MAVPKKRKSKSKSRMRRAGGYFNAKAVQLHECPHCKGIKRTHSVCPSCGYYKNKLVIQSQ